MDLAFPEKYHEVAKYFDFYIGDLEQTPLLTDEQRLLFYALRQQADHGPCTSPQPSMWYLTERHKHQAWKQLGRMSTFEAMVFFVQQFERLLWTLEHPDDDEPAAAAAASTNAKIDWPARLRELPKPQATATAADVLHPHAPDNAAAASSSEHKAAVSSKQAAEQPNGQPSPTPSPAPPALKPAPIVALPECLSEAEMRGWDADVVAHAALTLDNLRFLAAELMHARRALRQASAAPESHIGAVASPAVHRDNNANQEVLSMEKGASSNVPLPPPRPSLAPDAAAMATPPLKPMWTPSGVAASVSIIPPPMRLSARSMTMAATRPPREMLIIKGDAPSPTSLNGDSAATWFNW